MPRQARDGQVRPTAIAAGRGAGLVGGGCVLARGGLRRRMGGVNVMRDLGLIHFS